MEIRMAAGWQGRLDRAVEDFMGGLAGDIRSDASRFAPRRTGRLAASISSYRVRPKTWRIHARAPYAGFVELGTRPHAIRPVRARALRWVDASGVHFARRVWHPGTRPQPYLRPALTAARG